MTRARPGAPADAPRRIFVTDLDGTLLDEQTYDYSPARPAIAAIARAGARLVLASSKTAAEMIPLAREIGPGLALIVENGGAVLIPRDDGTYDSILLGAERAILVQALAEISREVGGVLRGFSSVPIGEIVAWTGLSPRAAELAAQRQWDEPFRLEDEGLAPAILAAAESRGLRLTRGGRFFHLTGDSDKGRALSALRDLETDAPPCHTIGLGDAPNDLDLLRSVDRPILMPRRAGGVDPALTRALPRAEHAPEAGPSGWNRAVLAVLAGVELPRAATKAGD